MSDKAKPKTTEEWGKWNVERKKKIREKQMKANIDAFNELHKP